MSYLYLRGKGKKQEIWIGFSKRTGLKRRKLGISLETVPMRNGKVMWPTRARELQQAIDTEVAKGTFGIHDARPIPRFSDLKKEFLLFKGDTISKAQHDEYITATKKLIEDLGDLPVSNYTTLSLGILRSKLLETLSWNTVAKTFRNLSALFNYAKSEFNIPNPITKTLKLKQDIKNPRVFSEEELSAFLVKAAEINRPLYDQAMYLLLAGMRVTESCIAQFSNLDFKRECIDYRNIKGKRNDIFPMDAALKEFLQSLPKTYAPFVFKYRRRRPLENAFNDVSTAAKLPDELSLHNLKKTFSTLLADTNAPIYIAQDLSRHTDIRTTLRYYVYKRLEAKRDALAASRVPIIHLLNKAK